MDNHINTGYKQELKRVLPLSALVFYGLAYISLIGAFTMYGVTTVTTHGMFALCFLIATISMSFTALSYAKMSAVYPIAGSAYSYTQRTINPYAGFMTGWVVLLDYALLPITNFLLLGLYLNTMIPQIPAWVFSLFFIIVISLINIRGIKIAAGANMVLIVIQLVFLFALIIFMLKWLLTGNGAATLFSIKGIYDSAEISNVGWGTIFTSTSALCLCFLGFDAITTLAEETLEPEKNIGKALIIACIGAGAIFVVVGYLSQLSWPEAWQMIESPDTGAVELVGHVASSVMSYLFAGIYCVGCFGSGIASQSSAARLLFGMGRDRGLPKVLGRVSKKYQTPVVSILVVAAIGCVSLVIDLMSIASIINFGALLAFTMVNICVIRHYYIGEKKRGGKNVWKYLICPAIGAIIAFVIWINLDSKAMILGLAWTAVGIIFMAITTKGFKQPPIDIDFSEN